MIAYLDNAATTRLHPEVRSAMEPYFGGVFGNPSSLHAVGRAANKAVNDARERIAAALGCDPKEIVFTSCATESNSLAISSASGPVVTSAIEHPSVLQARAVRVPVDRYGRVDPSEVPADAFVSVMWANNEIGTVQPIAEIARRKRGLLHTDAAQALGKVPISLDGVDLMTFSAHKIHGPKGVGGLFVRKGTRLTPMLVGGGQEFERRAGTENVPLIVGMAKAVELALRPEGRAHMERMRERLRQGLARIPRAHVHGHPTERLPSILNVSFEGVDGEAVLIALDAEGICASTGSACASLSAEPSHVLKAMGIAPELLRSSIRFSVAADTTEAEIDRAVAVVPKVVEKLRRISPAYE